jgi:Arc/MetJ-type ribon-helix-helix transcriptional regulator
MAFSPFVYYNYAMKILTVRLPDALVAEIEAEARRRMISKSDVVRERLTRPVGKRSTAALDQIADLVGSIDGLPSDLSANRRSHHGRKRDR